MQGMTLGCLQRLAADWQERNFGPQQPYWLFMGVAEEVGELSHALLKSEQGIRGSATELDAQGKDAVGDILIYLVNLCTAKGWDVQEIIEETWAIVSKRDWKQFPKNGLTE